MSLIVVTPQKAASLSVYTGGSASRVQYVPTGNAGEVTATDVQGAISAIDGRLVTAEAAIAGSVGSLHSEWLPSTGSTISSRGLAPTIVGTASTPALATTNMASSLRRTLITSAATANSAAELYSGLATVWRGNASGLGGFTFRCRFRLETIPANFTFFVGLVASTSAIAATANVATGLSNYVGVGSVTGDTSIRSYVGGVAPGAAVDLGASYPANNTAAVYLLTITAGKNATNIVLTLTREDTGSTYTATLSAALPANTSFLAPHVWCANGGTASAAAIAVMMHRLESER